jgi:hypothetical protein
MGTFPNLEARRREPAVLEFDATPFGEEWSGVVIKLRLPRSASELWELEQDVAGQTERLDKERIQYEGLMGFRIHTAVFRVAKIFAYLWEAPVKEDGSKPGVRDMLLLAENYGDLFSALAFQFYSAVGYSRLVEMAKTDFFQKESFT